VNRYEWLIAVAVGGLVLLFFLVLASA